MKRKSLSHTFRRSLRALLRYSRELRRMCVSLLTIAMAISKIIEIVTSFYSSCFT